MLKQIKIGNKKIGGYAPIFIVAEIGVNHNQNLQLAKESIKAAAASGADAVKFQTWKTENIILKDTTLASYQKPTQPPKTTQFDMLKRIELPYEWHKELKDYAEENDVIFFSTMEDTDSVDFLINEIKIPMIKVGSGDLTNYPLIDYTAAYGIPMVLSTGMSTLGEIEEAVEIIRSKKNDRLIVCQCTSDYPVQYHEVNLRALQTIASAFKVFVGFSDHTVSIECPIAAAALGICYLEKHFTLDNKLPGPDHKMSLNPRRFQEMVKVVRNTERALGDGIKTPTISELKNRPITQRRIVASRKIVKDEELNLNNITFKRANKGLNASFYKNIVGKRARCEIDKDELIQLEYFKE
jgi:N-acetylneuraminate synthase